MKPLHACEPPITIRTIAIHMLGEESEHTHIDPDGSAGGVWRCRCRALWLLRPICDMCNQVGRFWNHPGLHLPGRMWRPATPWQRLTHWRTK